jgi:hypothetical protein
VYTGHVKSDTSKWCSLGGRPNFECVLLRIRAEVPDTADNKVKGDDDDDDEDIEKHSPSEADVYPPLTEPENSTTNGL